MKIRTSGAIVTLSAGIVVLYGLAAALVFDFRGVSYSDQEENYMGRPVAFGPALRLFFISSEPLDKFGCHRLVAIGPRLRMFWMPASETFCDGTEWQFRMFAPVCAVWRRINGYAKPATWR